MCGAPIDPRQHAARPDPAVQPHPDAETRTPGADTRTPGPNTRKPGADTLTPKADTRTPEANTRTPEVDTRTPAHPNSETPCEGAGEGWERWHRHV